MAPLLRAIGTLASATTLLSGCATTGCEEWGTRVESVKVCGPKASNCTFQDQPVQYCVRRTGERAAPAAVASKDSGTASLQPKAPASKPAPQERAATPPEKTGKASPSKDKRAQATDKTGMPNLT